MIGELLDVDKLREEANTAFNTVKELGKGQGKLMLLTGQVLKDITQRKLFQYMGDGGFDTFHSFLGQVNMKPSTAYLYIDIYSYCIEKKKMSMDEVAEIPLVRLQKMLSYLKKLNNPQQEDELLEKAKLLSSSDFEQALAEDQIIDARRLRIFKHQECGKYCVEYYPESICICEGVPYVKPIAQR